MEDRLRNLRKAQGYTQEKLSLELNVSRQTISNWERGSSIPDIENLKLLSKFYEVPVSYLMDGGFSQADNVKEHDLNRIKSMLLLLTVSAFFTPLAAFVLLFFTFENKEVLPKKWYKMISLFGFGLSLVNLLVIAFVAIDLLFL